MSSHSDPAPRSITDTSVQATSRKRGPWPFLAAGFLLLHATGMAFAVRAAVFGGGARELREPVQITESVAPVLEDASGAAENAR